MATLPVLCSAAALETNAGPAPHGRASAAAVTLDHVALHVADVQVSVDFYIQVLGLKEIASGFPGRRWIGIGETGAIRLAGDRKTPVPEDDSCTSRFAVASLDPILARLKSRGVTWFGSDDAPCGISTLRRDGVRQIYFKDPDG